MVLVLLEMVGFNDSLSFDIWVEIQGHGGVGMVRILSVMLIASRRSLFV